MESWSQTKPKSTFWLLFPASIHNTPHCPPRQPRSQPKHTATGPQHRHPYRRSNQQDSRILEAQARRYPNHLEYLLKAVTLKNSVKVHTFGFCTLTILQPIQHQILLTVTIYEAIRFKAKPVNHTLKLTLLCFFSIKKCFFVRVFLFYPLQWNNTQLTFCFKE